MSDSSENWIAKMFVERWASWLLELVVLSVIAYFTIAEVRKTNEQTRAMLARYDAAISKYAAEKSDALDSAVSTGFEAAKSKASELTIKDIKEVAKSLRESSNEQSGDNNGPEN